MANKRLFTPALSEEKREQIRAYRKAHPRMKYRQIAAIFGVSVACICQTVNPKTLPTKSLPKPELRPKILMRLPTCSVQRPDSIISPIPLSLLMGGNARRARTA